MATRTKLAEKIAKAHDARRPKKKGSTSKPTLSEAHRAVVDAYFANGCVSQRRALIAAGYSETTAKNQPQTVFQRDDVRAEIEKRRARHEKNFAVTEDRIIAELAALAFARMGDLVEVNEDGSAELDFNRLTPEMKAAMSEFSYETLEQVQDEVEADADGEISPKPRTIRITKPKIKFGSKQAALDALVRIKGMNKADRIEVSGALSLVERIQAARQRLQPGKAT